jgi:hypothetical protein
MAGAGIPSTAIAAGRTATIVGIAKRPYPTATDRRFALLPRSAGDLAFGPASATGSTGTTGGTGTGAGGTGGGTTVGDPGASLVDAAADTDLIDLAAHVGQPVTVAGLIAALTSDGFVLDDGTATATVVLSGDALELEPYLHVGDALAASGVVTTDGDELRIRVSIATDLVRVGDLGQAMPVTGSPAPGPEAAAADATAGARPGSATLAGASGFDTVGPLGLGAMLTLSALSIAVTLFRRQQERRRLRAVIVARLAAFHPSTNPTDAERESA